MQHADIVKEHADLKGFGQHGVVFERIEDKQVIGLCPWCGKKGKMFINIETRLWDCKVCGVSGNWEQFLERAHIEDRKKLKGLITKPLTKDRGLSSQTFRAFGFGWNGQDYTYPVRDMKKIVDLKRYRPGKRGLSTKGGKIGLIGPEKRVNSQRVWVCEGEWDALALFEILHALKIKEDVYAVCGASNFPKHMVALFEGREVILCFDCDSPGQRGLAKAWDLLGGTASNRQRLEWPSEDLPDGYDLRDLYHDAGRDKQKAWKTLQSFMTDRPPEDAKGAQMADARSNDQDTVDPNGKGMKPAQVFKEFQKWLVMESEEVLDVLFGSIFANRIHADPFWIFFVAPPGGAKSEFLMTLLRSPLIHFESSLTPHSLISGMDLKGGADPSLLAKIMLPHPHGKVLVVKDVTTILQMPQIQRDEIFGTLRDAYDGRCSKTYGNGLTRVYEGEFGVVGGVTPSIDEPAFGNSILGERFVKYRIPMKGKITKGKKACKRVLQNLTKKHGMRDELMEVSKKVLDRPVTEDMYPVITDRMMDKIVELAQWVANMRTFVSRDKYSRNVINTLPSAEVGTRLSGQLGILGMGIAIYRGQDIVDDSVYRILAKVARDTAPPKAEGIVKALYLHGEPVTSTDCAGITPFNSTTCLYALQDLASHGVLKTCPKTNTYWVHPNMKRVMDDLNLYGSEKAWRKGS